MRDIKFRQFIGVSDFHYWGNGPHDDGAKWKGPCSNGGGGGQYPSEQYTGRKDKNGKEIYEGDKIRFPILDYDYDKKTYAPLEKEYMEGVISFDSGTFIIDNGHKLWSDGIHDWYSIENIDFEFVSLTGNIHET